MTDEFRFLLLSAMYENGGNTTHRLFDGHPQMFVYPFESQLGTKLVSDMLTSVFPVKYRWPVFDLAAAPAEDYHAIIDEECKVRARTPQVSKFRDTPFDFSDDERKALYVKRVEASGRSRANNMAAFFRSTFDAWKDYRRNGEQALYVGYSPIVVVERRKDLERLARGARVARRQKPLVRLRRYQETPRTSFSRELLARVDAQPVPRACLPGALSGPASRFAARRHSRRTSRCTRGALRQARARCGRLARNAELQRQPPRAGVPVGHDPLGHDRRQPRDGGGVERFRARRSPRTGRALPGVSGLQEFPQELRLTTKRALVTGASGFVGAVLARRLLAGGHDVHLLVRPDSDSESESATWRLQGLEAPRHEVDLADDVRLTTVVRSVRPEWIFHLATHGAYSSQTDSRRMVRTNVLGTMNLVDAALGVGFEAFVNTGSSSEYGFTDHPPSEDERAEPASAYAITKLSQTLFCRFTAKKHDVHIPTLRLYSVYGPYEEPTRFVPTLIAHGLDRRLPPLASPDIARDFVYTEDVAEAFVLAAERNDTERGGIYNLGTGTQTKLQDAVRLARETFEITAEPEWATMPNRAWDTTTWVANVHKIERELGWKARFRSTRGFVVSALGSARAMRGTGPEYPSSPSSHSLAQ